jgi:hypothetical protein
MNFIDIFKAILGGNPLDGITKIIEEFHAKPLSEEEKKEFELKMAELASQQAAIQAARDQALVEVQGQNIRAETQSEDAYVRRARPTFMYIIESVLAFNYILLPIMQFFEGKTPAPIILPSDLLMLFGACVLGYAGFRSFDKFASLPGESKVELPLVKMYNNVKGQ